MLKFLNARSAATLATTVLAVGAAVAETDDVWFASVTSTSSNIVFTLLETNDGATLTLSVPGGEVESTYFSEGATPVIRAAGREDGTYAFELLLQPYVSDHLRAQLQASSEDDRVDLARELVASGALPEEPLLLSGAFTINGGSIVSGSTTTTRYYGDWDNAGPTRDQQILDDLIVTQSLCVGQDCNNGESFGFDTIRLKENNLRIRFFDTSNSASFPTNDWQLTANDSSNGGKNRFSIDDIDSGRTPFTVEAAAPAHALYVKSNGDIGLGTSTPVTDIHAVSGDSPTLRLDQDGSSGFTPQRWDVAGNETNFFIRDATNGSKLPFKIRPGAPDNSIYVDTDGDVGFGTASPLNQVDIRGDMAVFATPSGPNILGTFHNENLGADDHARVIIKVDGSVDPDPRLHFITQGQSWSMGINNANDRFSIGTGLGLGSGAAEALSIDATTREVRIRTDLTVDGTLNTPSDVNMKDAFEPVSSEQILDKVLEIPVLKWRYKTEDDSIRHVGPTAQEFHQAFGLGRDDKHIATVDADGVALAAIQGLNQRLLQALEQRDAQIAELEARLNALESHSR